MKIYLSHMENGTYRLEIGNNRGYTMLIVSDLDDFYSGKIKITKDSILKINNYYEFEVKKIDNPSKGYVAKYEFCGDKLVLEKDVESLLKEIGTSVGHLIYDDL